MLLEIMITNNNKNTEETDKYERKSVSYCPKLACEIQYCLQRANYQQHKCQDLIDTYKQCESKSKGKSTMTQGK